MSEYYAYDLSVPARGLEGGWNEERERISRQEGQALMEYFTALAKKEGVENELIVCPPGIGVSPPRLILLSDNEAAIRKVEAASNGRLSISKFEPH